MYAIVKTGGKQYSVRPGDVFDVEKLPGSQGDTVELPVLFLNDGKQIVTDAAKLAATKVVAQIVEQHKGEKQIVFKFKKRKGYKRTNGHRQQLTKIAIVEVAGEKAAAPAPKKDAVEEADGTKNATVEKASAEKAKAPKTEKPSKADGEKSAEAESKDEDVAVAAEAAAADAAEAAEDHVEDAATDAEDAAVDAAEAAAEAAAAVDLNSMTVAELKDYAKEHGVALASGARKAEIVETIEKALGA